MPKIENFEDLNCWQAARRLVQIVYAGCEEGKLARDFETRTQVKRAALSTMNNIAEGFGRRSDKEFTRFLDIAKASAMEVRSITYVLSDLDYLTKSRIEAIRNASEEVKSLILGLIMYLNKKKTH